VRTTPVPFLLTPGRIADELGTPLLRVLYVLATRRHILPAARAGTLRLFDWGGRSLRSATNSMQSAINGPGPHPESLGKQTPRG